MTIQLFDAELERRYVGDLLHASHAEQRAHLAQPDRVAATDMASATTGAIVGAVHELVRDPQVDISPLTIRPVLEQRGATAAIEQLDMIVTRFKPQLDSLAVMSARLRDLARARRLRDHHLRAAEAASGLDFEAAHEHAHEALGEQDHAHIEIVSLHGSAIAAVAAARRGDGGRALRRVPLGYPLLDNALKGGLRPATMAIVGGRTGAGKSSLMLGSAILQASAHGIRVGIVSCEDAADIWGERAIGHFASRPTDELIGQQLALGGSGDLEDALAALKRIGVQLAYVLNRPLADVLTAVRALIADGCRVIYVDYIQAIRLGRGADRKDLISDAAQQLKSECQLHGAVLVLGSQLSRADRRDRFAEPVEQDLKESGDLENMTEVAILLWKDSDGDDAKALGKVAKVKWSPRRPRFELERDDVTGVLRNVVAVERSEGNGHKHTRKPAWQ